MNSRVVVLQLIIQPSIADHGPKSPLVLPVASTLSETSLHLLEGHSVSICCFSNVVANFEKVKWASTSMKIVIHEVNFYFKPWVTLICYDMV